MANFNPQHLTYDGTGATQLLINALKDNNKLDINLAKPVNDVASIFKQNQDLYSDLAKSYGIQADNALSSAIQAGNLANNERQVNDLIARTELAKNLDTRQQITFNRLQKDLANSDKANGIIAQVKQWQAKGFDTGILVQELLKSQPDAVKYQVISALSGDEIKIATGSDQTNILTDPTKTPIYGREDLLNLLALASNAKAAGQWDMGESTAAEDFLNSFSDNPKDGKTSRGDARLFLNGAIANARTVLGDLASRIPEKHLRNIVADSLVKVNPSIFRKLPFVDSNGTIRLDSFSLDMIKTRLENYENYQRNIATAQSRIDALTPFKDWDPIATQQQTAKTISNLQEEQKKYKPNTIQYKAIQGHINRLVYDYNAKLAILSKFNPVFAQSRFGQSTVPQQQNSQDNVTSVLNGSIPPEFERSQQPVQQIPQQPQPQSQQVPVSRARATLNGVAPQYQVSQQRSFFNPQVQPQQPVQPTSLNDSRNTIGTSATGQVVDPTAISRIPQKPISQTAFNLAMASGDPNLQSQAMAQANQFGITKDTSSDNQSDSWFNKLDSVWNDTLKSFSGFSGRNFEERIGYTPIVPSSDIPEFQTNVVTAAKNAAEVTESAAKDFWKTVKNTNYGNVSGSDSDEADDNSKDQSNLLENVIKPEQLKSLSKEQKAIALNAIKMLPRDYVIAHHFKPSDYKNFPEIQKYIVDAYTQKLNPRDFNPMDYNPADFEGFPEIQEKIVALRQNYKQNESDKPQEESLEEKSSYLDKLEEQGLLSMYDPRKYTDSNPELAQAATNAHNEKMTNFKGERFFNDYDTSSIQYDPKTNSYFTSNQIADLIDKGYLTQDVIDRIPESNYGKIKKELQEKYNDYYPTKLKRDEQTTLDKPSLLDSGRDFFSETREKVKPLIKQYAQAGTEKVQELWKNVEDSLNTPPSTRDIPAEYRQALKERLRSLGITLEAYWDNFISAVKHTVEQPVKHYMGKELSPNAPIVNFVKQAQKLNVLPFTANPATGAPLPEDPIEIAKIFLAYTGMSPEQGNPKLESESDLISKFASQARKNGISMSRSGQSEDSMNKFRMQKEELEAKDNAKTKTKTNVSTVSTHSKQPEQKETTNKPVHVESSIEKFNKLAKNLGIETQENNEPKQEDGKKTVDIFQTIADFIKSTDSLIIPDLNRDLLNSPYAKLVKAINNMHKKEEDKQKK